MAHEQRPEPARTVAGFRQATPSDIDTILELMSEYYRQDGYEFEEALSRRALAGLLANETLGCLWVLEDGQGVAGYLAVTLGYSLEYGGRDAFVDELFLADRARGRGAGRAALDTAEAWCRSRGVRALHLEVEQHRERALALYRAHGFEDHRRRLMTKWLGSGPRVAAP